MSSLDEKSRNFVTISGELEFRAYADPQVRTYRGTDYEHMVGWVSERGWRRRLGKTDEGHVWSKSAYLQRHEEIFVDIYRDQYRWMRGGQVAVQPRDGSVANPTGTGGWPTLPSGGLNPITAGATAISRCAPTVPASDTLVALAEIIREGIPKASSSILTKGFSRRSLADDYLNFEFGWKPFVNDLRSLAKAIYESDDLIVQLMKNSGKIVRRGYRFPTVTTTSEISVGNQSPYPTTNVYLVSTGPRIVSTVSTIDTWFSGAFTYYADLRGSTAYERVSDVAQKARLLYGIKLTPDVVWNLLPWSWLIDWQTNIGDVLTNVGLFANDGLVMHYGYVMQEHKALARHVLQPKYYGEANPRRLTSEFESSKKARYRASPWGFGLDESDFTARQGAILLALGMSRG